AGPVADGLAWLCSLRERRHRVAVITLTVPDAVEIRIAAVDCEADDHLIHPVDARELLARCRALIRPPRLPPCEDVVSWGELSVDSRKREVRHGVAPIDLTPREWSILEFLMEHAGTAVSKDRLVHAVASRDERLAPNAIEVYVSRLRAKLAGTGARISTLRGLGYRLEQPAEAERGRVPAEEQPRDPLP
ncbi:MAG: winged helix-turn-helix domain-containing protein, partial [Gammaproteobacteria bacterium]